jgi:predicted MFS family arabinose efflux permease
LIKPILGYYIDCAGFTKKQWLIGACLLSTTICLLLGFLPTLSIIPLVILLTLVSSSAAIRDVANDGMMCFVGKEHNATGKIQAVQWVAVTVAGILTGIGGGWLAENFDYQTAYLLLIPFYILLGYMLFRYKSDKSEVIKKESLWIVLKQLFTDKNLLLVCLFIFLYNFAPSLGTPLFFVMRDDFGWSKQWIGTLGTIGAVCSIIGALLYYKFSKYLDIKKALIISIFVGAITTLAYLYFTPVTAVVYDVINSVIGMFVQLLLLDFVARETKYGMEAISFALFCSVINLASTCDDLVGGFLLPIVGLKWLIIIAAFSSFLCLFLINKIKFK